jgi:oligo-1,6-glucosidase
MLATILHLHRGTPYIYQGEELGMTNPGFTSLEEYRDIDSLNYVAQNRELDLMDDDRLLQALAFGSRDNARTPMQWDSSPQAGFTTGEPWIAVNPNHTQMNAETERADPHSVFHHYRRLIALRHTDETVRLGDFHLLLPQDPAVYAFTRTLDGDALLVVGNFTGDHQDIDLAAMSGTWAELVLGNYPDAAAPMSTHLRLRPWEALVLRGVTH